MRKRSYKHIFFDLDHTLWDFDKNSAEALQELYVSFKLSELGGFMADAFVQTFHEVNEHLWSLYSVGKLESESLRNERFGMIFTRLGADAAAVPETLATEYLQLCPTKPYVLPYTFEILDYLKDHYVLHIVTNGFDDVQAIKMKSAGLSAYFVEIITSNGSGYKKPHPKIFDFAIEKAKACREECIMIGDNLEADIVGARNAGLDHIFFNHRGLRHNEQVTYEIDCLSKLKSIL
jgi:putative hydrolase of the HAD superfamily